MNKDQPRQNCEEGCCPSCSTRTLSVSSLTISVFSLLSSVLIIITFILYHFYVNEEVGILHQRLDDLEAEHDYLVENNKVPKLCSLPPDPGPCTSKVERWYYLARVDDCIQFPWGGCQGNENNFLSQAQCQAACQVSSEDSTSLITSSSPSSVLSSPLVSVPPSTSLTKFCSLPPDSGPCQDRLVRYYFDPENSKCQKFQYGGCSGNENNYFSLGECERICLNPSISRKSTSPRRRNTCMMAEDAGTCEGHVSRWRWDQSRGECVMFTWSGCGGNSNNFNTKDKCVFRCGDKN